MSRTAFLSAQPRFHGLQGPQAEDLRALNLLWVNLVFTGVLNEAVCGPALLLGDAAFVVWPKVGPPFGRGHQGVFAFVRHDSRKVTRPPEGCVRQQLAFLPRMRHSYGMTATVRLDGSNRIVLSRDLRRAAGIPRGQKLKVSATPGRVVLEVEPNPGTVVRRGKLKMWTGQVPATPIEEAVDVVRHYER